MMIAYPPACICYEIKEHKIFSLIIEEPHTFFSLITDIRSQLDSEAGYFVLSEDYQPMELRKSADMITQFVPFTVNQKDLIGKLYSEFKQKAVDEKMYQSTNEMIAFVSHYLYKLTEESDYELSITRPEDISGILKMFDLRFDDREMSLPEKLLEYMIVSREIKGIRVFITVNLRSYLTDKQTEQFFESAILNKLPLICIENCEHSRLTKEDVVIIDKDMCII